MDGWMDGGRVEEEMGAQGLEGWGKGILVTLPPSVVSFSWGTERAVLQWELPHRPHTMSTQQAQLWYSNWAFQQHFTLVAYITHTHLEPGTGPSFKQAAVSQLEFIINRCTSSWIYLQINWFKSVLNCWPVQDMWLVCCQTLL